MSKKFNYKDSVPFDLRVLLETLDLVMRRFQNGLFDYKTWNCLLKLYISCPKVVRKDVSFKKLYFAKDNKELCINLFSQMYEPLEDAGFLRNASKVERTKAKRL